MTGGLTLLIYALVNAQSWGWGSGRFIGLVIGAAVLLAVFIVAELRSRAPLVRLAIFRIRSLAGANAAMFLLMGGQIVTLFFPTLYMQDVFGYSPIKTGLAYVVWPVTMVVTAAIGQKLVRRFDPRLTLAAGLLIVSGGLLAFHSMSVHGSYPADVLPGLLLTAAGTGPHSRAKPDGTRRIARTVTPVRISNQPCRATASASCPSPPATETTAGRGNRL